MVLDAGQLAPGRSRSSQVFTFSGPQVECSWRTPRHASVIAGASATFDGRGGNMGENMTYARTGDALLISANFLHKGVPDHVEWHMIRKGD